MAELQIHVSWLKITDLEPTDRGFYACQASNGIDKIKSEGVLDVYTKWGNGGPPSEIPLSKPVFENKHK